MKIIKNSIIPFKGYLAINLFGTLFVRSEYAYKLELEPYKAKVLNHESIHTEQMKDFARFMPKFIQQYIGGIVFYIIYLLEWLFKVIFMYPFSHEAYRNISFEREAFQNEKDLSYIDNRKLFAQWKILQNIKLK